MIVQRADCLQQQTENRTFAVFAELNGPQEFDSESVSPWQEIIGLTEISEAGTCIQNIGGMTRFAKGLPEWQSLGGIAIFAKGLPIF